MSDRLIHRVCHDLEKRGIDPASALWLKQTERLPPLITAAEYLALTQRVGYEKAWAIIRARIELAQLEGGVAAARASSALAAVMEAARINEFDAEFRPAYAQTTRAAYMRGARVGADRLAEANVTFRFDTMNPLADAYAQRMGSRLITEVTDDQRESVRALISRAVSEGRTIQETARDIRSFVGLRSDQVLAIERFRTRLEAEGKLSADRIARKVERYGEKLLRQRGELIARTETLRAANHGQLATWLQAAEQQLIQAAEMRKKWIFTNDELACDPCLALNGESVPLSAQFETEEFGAVDAPPLHPNCRCTLVLVRKSDE